MTLYLSLVAGIAGCCASLVFLAICLAAIRAGRENTAQDMRSIQGDCERRAEELTAALVSAEAGMQSTAEMLRDGRLSRSSRARALQLLRSGVSPETAAESMGMATREMQLLARVS